MLPGKKFQDAVDVLWVNARNGPVDDAEGLLRSAGVLTDDLTEMQHAELNRWWGNEQLAQEEVARIATTRMINDMVPYIDNPGVRSQAADIARNIWPFWAAEEQFYKRWIRTAKRSPEGIRKLQLGFHGMQAVGWIDQDQNGDYVFNYPGSGLVMGVIARVQEMLPGEQVYSLPVNVGLSGNVERVIPGLDTLGGVASPGPVVGLSLTFLANIDPSLARYEEAVMRGERSYMQQILPSMVYNTFQVFNATEEDRAAAVVGAIAMLDANGHGPQEGWSDREKQRYLDRVSNYADTVQLGRTLFGAFGPTAARAEFDPEDLNERWRELITKMGIDEGTRVFLAENEDATAWTVSSSEVVSRAPIQPTRATFDALNENAEFYDTYSNAGPWLTPHEYGDDIDFDQQAWRKLFADEIRRYKKPDEFLDDIIFKGDSQLFFDSKEAYETTRAGLEGPEGRAVDLAWSQWSQRFYETHPTFSSVYRGGDNKDKRTRVMSEIREALADERLPAAEVAQAEPLRELVDGYDFMVGAWEKLQAIPVQTEAVQAQKKALKWAFEDWATLHSTKHPTVEQFWRLILHPDLQAAERPVEPTEG